jgi:hypothetical protein
MSGRVVATLLYEDQRGPTSQFGLHRLVTALVHDRVNGQRHLLEQALDGRPMKGDHKVIDSARYDIDKICSDGRWCIAVLDDDRVRRTLNLPSTATAAEVVDEIRRPCVVPDRLRVVLLDRNVESVLRAIQRCDPELDAVVLERAVERKEVNARDLIFRMAAGAGKRSVRDCLMIDSPLKELSGLLCTLLMEAPRSDCSDSLPRIGDVLQNGQTSLD